jgi:predicted nucleotidyltransferase component of viral defense system
MLLASQKDAIHKAWLYRLLSAICDHKFLVNQLRFKGGTCAAMQGFLDRFSLDLDFDYVGQEKDLSKTRTALEHIFKNIGLEIKDKSKNVPQYFLKYSSKENERNTLKIDINFPSSQANKYEPVRLIDINRIIDCQTIETMFANKLVALIDRYEKNNSIAGRDIYDIHYFFMHGYTYNKEVIKERRGIDDLKIFFNDLIEFIEKHITETIINQDLNTLLPNKSFQKIRKILKQEVLIFLRDELKNI